AIGEYVAAGGDLSAVVSIAADPADNVTIGDLLVDLNDALTVSNPITTVEQEEIDDLVDAIGAYTDYTASPDSAAAKAVDAALDKVIQRDALTEAADAAQLAVEGAPALTDVVAAEAAITAREALIQADQNAQSDLADAE